MKTIRLPPARSVLLPLFLTGLIGACGLPLVPDENALEDQRLTSRMELVMECRLLGVGPQLPESALGPEPDTLPLLVPLPEAPDRQAFLVLPQVTDGNGGVVLSSLKRIGPRLGSGAALVYGLRIDPARSTHEINFDADWPNALGTMVPLAPPSYGQRRFDLNLYQAPGSQTSRLILGGIGSQGSRSTLHAIDFPDSPLSENLSAGSAGSPLIQVSGAFLLEPWEYRPSTPLDNTAGPPANTPLNLSWPAAAGPAPWQTGAGSVLFTLPLRNNLLVVYRNATALPLPPSNRLHLGFLAPWQDAAVPQAASLSTAAMGTLSTDQLAGLASVPLSGAFVAWNPNLYGGQLTIAAYQPDEQGRFRYYRCYRKNAVWLADSPVATNWPPVRILADGSLLSLRDGKWTRGRFGNTGQLLATSDGIRLATGSLQFLYESTEAGVVWMIFSQAVPVPGVPGGPNDLILRAWKIREADFFNATGG